MEGPRTDQARSWSDTRGATASDEGGGWSTERGSPMMSIGRDPTEAPDDLTRQHALTDYPHAFSELN